MARRLDRADCCSVRLCAVNGVEVVDTHCHLADYASPMDVVHQAEAVRTGIVAVTGHPDEYRRLRARLGPRAMVTVALGLHPLRAATFRPIDLARFFRFVPEARWIGEVGLDFSPQGIGTKRQQIRVFETVLSEAQPRRHPLTVHTRGAERETIDRLAQVDARAVLHWYSGPLTHVDDALAAGAYFSINPTMLRSSRSAQLVAAVPRERILLETDGPFARVGRREARPTDLVKTLEQVAHRWSVAPDEARAQLASNYDRLTG